MSRQEILDALPHRPPFLLVDEIVQRSPQRIVCRKTFAADEYFFAGHYPDHPLVPGVLLCEAALQAGAVLLAGLDEGPAGRLPVATRINDVRFKAMVRPGETISIEVDLLERLANACFLKAKITRQGAVAARLEFAVALVDRAADAAG